MHDLKARRATADALATEGKRDEAVREYTALAAAYAGSGLLLRAVAVCKQILALDPAHHETQRLLATLYAQRSAEEGNGVGDDGDPISVSDEIVQLLPPPLPPDADDDAIDVDAIAAVLTKLPAGSVRLERPADVPLFSSLAPSSFQALVEQTDAWEAEPGAIIVAEGEASDSLFVVVRGAVRVERAGAGGPATIARLSAGSFFGEMALMSSKTRSASVVAEQRAELLEIPRAVLDGLLANDARVAAALDGFCRARLIDNLAHTSPLVAGLDAAVAKSVLKLFSVRKVEAGTSVIAQDQPGPGLFVVVQGSLDVIASSEVGPVRLKELGVGDVFGEMSLLSSDAASASVIAAQACTLLVLPRVAFAELVVGHPALRVRLERLAAERRARNERFLPDVTESAILV